MKRGFDILVALLTLVTTSWLFLLAAVGIKLSSAGPIFYPATRVGLNGRLFTMYKFRSMHVSNEGSVITSHRDVRVFFFGNLLRILKIDELPQFLNVLKGDMSIVGPRPEDPKIVNTSYTPWMKETLNTPPGITSPGSLFYYAYCEDLIDPNDAEGSYIDLVLPLKLAFERSYMDRTTFFGDLKIILLTPLVIIGKALGFTWKTSIGDIQDAQNWVDPSKFENIL